MNPEKIEDLMMTTFLNTPIVEKIYVKSEQSGLQLVIVYNSESISSAIKQIQPGLVKLEDEFPDVYFKPHFFHTNDFHEGHYQHLKLIFGR